MRQSSVRGLAPAGAGAWLLLVCLVALREAEVPITPVALSVGAALSLVLSVAGAARSAWGAWRGPRLAPFPNDDALACRPPEAAIVRAAAQLRGTLGGAGWVHRGRLALSTGAWVAAALSALAVLGDPEGARVLVPAVATLALGAAAVRFPARPFYYREATNGWLLVHPRDAFAWLSSARAPVRAQERRDPEAPGGSGGGGASARTWIAPSLSRPVGEPASHGAER